MGQIQWMLSLIPDSIFVWVYYILTIAGVSLYIGSKLVRWIPMMGQYKLPAELVGVVLLVVGAYLFGGVTMLQFHLQGIGVEVPSQFLSMLPYVATIVVLVLICRDPRTILLNQPASLGKSFHPDV